MEEEKINGWRINEILEEKKWNLKKKKCLRINEKERIKVKKKWHALPLPKQAAKTEKPPFTC
jgi:hypothetical protein